MTSGVGFALRRSIRARDRPVSLVVVGAATSSLGAPAFADTVDPDSPGLEYRVENLNLPVEKQHFPSGTVSGGVLSRRVEVTAN